MKPKPDTINTKELRDLPCTADILDYSPPSYCPPPEWLAFQRSFADEMRRILNRTSPDDLNDGMFDNAIDAAVQKARDIAAQQHIDHLALIRRRQGVLRDRLTQSIRFRSLLEEDLTKVDKMIAELPAVALDQTTPD